MVKNPFVNAADAGLIPGLGRSSGGGNATILAWITTGTKEPNWL